MNKAFLTIKIFLISFIITFLLIISILGASYYNKEKERLYVDINKIVLKEVIQKQDVFHKIEHQRQLEEINDGILDKKNDEIDETLDKEYLKDLKTKKKFENKIAIKIKQHWKKPFNFKNGSSCNIIVYYKKEIKYSLKECVPDAIFKRSVELSLIKVIENANKSQFKKYTTKNKLSLIFLP
jgi:hypothetical protein